MGKALDDRAGCAMLIKLIQSELEYDCTFVFTVQEEIGCVGAKAAAYTVKPDISIVVETTTAGDLAGVAPNKKVCALKNGPVVPFMDRGTVYDRELYDRAHAVANRLGIPCQTKEGVYGGTEGRSIQTAGAGAKVLAVSLPCRYLHSASCLLAQQDMQQELQLLQALIEEFAK
jgi:endoglucanase